MAAKNDVTGDSIRSRAPSDAYANNWERIFGKNKNKDLNKDSEEKKLCECDQGRLQCSCK